MYQFIYGNFSDTAFGLHGVEDCLNRGLTTNDFTVYVTQAAFDAFSATQAPMIEKETEEGVQQVPSPDFDPSQHLFWNKIQKIANVVIWDVEKGVASNEELNNVLKGARRYFEMGKMVIIVNQPIQQLA